jgi:predicted amidophosphoribosyltransferase
MNKFDALPLIYHLGFYHPKLNYHEDYSCKNHNFNEFSHLILELKERRYTAIDYFKDILIKLLEDEEVTITTVPPHLAFESNSGVRDLASCLVKSKKKYVDAVNCLERVTKVNKYSPVKGCRSEQEHFDSIMVTDRTLIKNKNIILMDDILTSANSVTACKRLLHNAGAKEIKILCLGKTIRDEKIDLAHDVIEENVQEFIFHTDVEADHNIIQVEKIYHDLFCYLAQELDEDDEEGRCELEYAMENEEKDELANIDYSIDHEKSEYCEYANEAHRALHGEDYLTPNNPFIQFL